MRAEKLLTTRVARRRVEADGICSFELMAHEGGDLPAFTAGAHVDVHLQGGIVRQYSLCNDPAERHRYVLGVLREPASRGGSRAMHDSIHEGDRLPISFPRNQFALEEAATHSLLLAGGIGITPLLAMAEYLARRDSSFDLHYCARSRARMAFHERLSVAPFAPRVHFHFDDGPAEQKLDLPALLIQPLPGVHLYVCGPKGFMDAVLDVARRHGWPENQLHCEYFSPATAASSTDQNAFQVTLARSGRVVAVPADKTVVEALCEAGVEIPTACGQGICGTCLTRVLDGIPEHRDLFLTPEEHAKNDQFTPCCSRAKSPALVLDL